MLVIQHLIAFLTEPNPVIDLTCESTSADIISLAWTRPEGDITGYRVDYQPVKDTDTTSDGGQTKPVNDQDKPVNDQHKPGDSEDKPNDGQEELVDSQDNLVNGQDKPNDGQEELVDSQDNLVNGQDKPNDGQEELVDGQDNQVNGQGEPVDDQDNLVDGQDKPNDGQDKQADDQNADIKSISIDSADTTKTEVTALTPGQTYQFNIFSMSGEEDSEKVTINCTTSKLIC